MLWFVEIVGSGVRLSASSNGAVQTRGWEVWHPAEGIHPDLTRAEPQELDNR
jgi:hypothetical protein